MASQCHSESRGGALVVALVFIVFASIIASTVATALIYNRNHVEAFVDSELSLQGAEWAAEQSRLGLENGGTSNIGIDQWQRPAEWNGATAARLLPALNAPGVAPASTPELPGVQFIAIAVDWAADAVDNNKDGAVDDSAEAGVYTVYAVAQRHAVKRAIEVVFRRDTGVATPVDSTAKIPLKQVSWRLL
ncbi:MAG: hypothetical protein K1Y02_14855 [Candidatus Hydrogenedentes bacterium]|nr:hypothetical protein [Candidatus Hydrogenedentota bacterium]